jgi:hypothetical protein
MSLGGNLSSGYTDQITENTIRCSVEAVAKTLKSDKCCDAYVPGHQPVAVYPSMLLASKTCPPPTPAEFAQYPKVAMPSSARTQMLSERNCAVLSDRSQRFSQYTRYTPPVPCQPLPQSANMAGISQPSTRLCNTTII